MESLPAAAAKKEGRLRNNCIPLYLMWFLIENFNLEITDVVAFTIMSPTVLLSPFSLRWEPGRNGQSGLNDDHSSRHNFVSVVSECVITLWCLSVCDHSVVSECVWSLCCVCGCVITLLCVCVECRMRGADRSWSAGAVVSMVVPVLHLKSQQKCI